jgi:hypothetical protein
MSRLRKWAKPALAIAAFLVVAQIAVSLLVRTHRVHTYLTAQLERAFGRQVQVQHFDAQILPSPSVDASGVTVAEDPSFGYEYFLRAERLRAGLRWRGLLRGHFDFGTLSLSHASLILVRNTEGRWNLERWLPPGKTPALAESARWYGPVRASAPANRLQKIEFDDGRIDFKNQNDKLPFAFTGVVGTVEQVATGRWQLRLEAQPWRSGVSLQSAGILRVRGDVAGTSARLQPAQIGVQWNRVSLADLFRLLRGQDYGVRGVFSLEGWAKSGPYTNNAANNVATGQAPPAQQPPVPWTFAIQGRAAEIHRWDLTERGDNPRLNLNLAGSWNTLTGALNVEQMVVEGPRSNLIGVANLAAGASPSLAVRVDSAGVQAEDLLAWYRAFHASVAEGISPEGFFTGEMAMRGWPLKLQELGFSSLGCMVTVPGLPEALRVGGLRGGLVGTRLMIDPVRIAFARKSLAEPVLGTRASPVARRPAEDKVPGQVDLALTHDFETSLGEVTVSGHLQHAEDLFNSAAAFGWTLNHGWELSGGASANLRWKWQHPLHGVWSGTIDIRDAELQAAGLNQPIQLDEAQLEWKNAKRAMHLARAAAFGTLWTGEIQEASAEASGSPQWRFNLHADRLDATELDRWVGPRARPGWLQRLLPSLLGAAAPSSPASELLRRIDAEGEVRVDQLTVERLKLSQLRVNGSLRDLQVDVRDAQAQWSGAKVRATMSAKFLPRPTYVIAAELDGLNLSQLPAALPISDRLAGTASLVVHLNTEGVGRDELLQKLDGRGELRLKNLEFRGWDVNASVADGEPHTGVSRWPAGEGDFLFAGRSVALSRLRLLDAAGALTFVNGTVTFGQDVDLSIENVSPGKRESRTLDEGRVLKVVGPMDDPRVSLLDAKARQPAD